MPTAKKTVENPRPRPATRDHLLSLKKPASKKVTLLLDPVAMEDYDAAREALGEATSDNRTEREKALEDAKAALAEASVTMRFQSIGRKKYDALIDAHPATDEQKADAKKQGVDEMPAYNIETFPPALIQASCADPELSEDDVQQIYDDWNNAEIFELFMAALEVNTVRRTGDLGNVFGPTHS